jgi:phytoene dehydrogenase-like protein
MWEKLPYAIQGSAANWDSLKESHGEAMLRLWSRFAPNLHGKTVIDSFTRSPLDTERTLPNMQGGDLLVGSFANGQVGYNRPFPGAGQYRTPVRGLYLCGGSTHPGGNVTGLCGYNCARAVAVDLNLPVWWNPPQIESAIEAL